MIKTFKYRIKDNSAKKTLRRHAYAVNQVWNYCAAHQRDINCLWKAITHHGMKRDEKKLPEPTAVRLTREKDGLLTFPIEPPTVYQSPEDFRREFQRTLMRARSFGTYRQSRNFDLTTKTTSKAVKAVERSFGIMLDGKLREDGSMFVTSSNLPHFSAVLPDGEWEEVLSYLKMFLERNVGKVKSIKIIHVNRFKWKERGFV